MITRHLVAFVAILLSFEAQVARADPAALSLRADSWCPYNCDAKSDKPGYVVEIARDIFAKAGLKVDYDTLNWARSIEEARQGHFDGIIGAIPGDAPDFVFPTQSIGQSGEGYAVRTGTPFRFDGAKSFDGKVMGAVSSYAWGGEIGAYVDAHKDDRSKIQLTSGDDALVQNFEKLLAGRIDIVMDDANVLAHEIAKAGLGDKITIADRGRPADIFIAFAPSSPKAKDYAALIDANLPQMRASGRLAEILSRYGVKDWR